MTRPSPFEPGYVPPKGAKLPPPLPAEAWQPRAEQPGPAWDAGELRARDPRPEILIEVEGGGDEPPEVEPARSRRLSAGAIALIAGLALVIGLGGGFGLGYFAGAEKSPQAGSGTSNVQRPAPAATPDRVDIEPPAPEIVLDPESIELSEAAERAEKRAREREARTEVLQQKLRDAEDPTILLLPNAEETFEVAWGAPITVDDWLVRAAQPRDAADEILEFSSDNAPPPDGYAYEIVELKVEYIGPTFAELGSTLTFVYVSDDGVVTFDTCGRVPYDVGDVRFVVLDEMVVANACLPVPTGTPGIWYMSFDGETWLSFS